VTAAHDSSWDSGTRLRVLLVEDDDGDALLVEEMLADTSVPFSLERVETLAAALAGPLTADCVVLDLQLPDAMGLSGLTKLGQHAPGVAIVVLTGGHDQATGVAAVAAGAQDYLVKDQVDGPLLSSSSSCSSNCSPGRTPGSNAACCPSRCCATGTSSWPPATARAATDPCWAATSTTRSSSPTAPCT
jgi:CheY-like chemotaxis protein